MVDYIGWCEECAEFKTIVIDTEKNYKTSYHEATFMCSECTQKQIIEKRDKKLNQLLKRSWFDKLFRN